MHSNQHSSQQGEGTKRIQGLDGLRCLAITSVISYHALEATKLRFTGAAWIDGVAHLMDSGYAGVDLFFVLSGFLITNILLQEKRGSATLGAYLWRFEVRRVLRIFPLYFALLLVRLAAYRTSPLNTRIPTAVFLFFLQNWWYGLSVPDPTWTGVTWSLGIEEQYYVLWPLVVWKLARKRLLALATGIIILAFCLRPMVFIAASEDAVYYWSITRMDSLAAGALLSILIEERWQRTLTVLRTLAAPLLLLLFLLCVTGNENTRTAGFVWLGYPLITLTFTCVLCAVVTNPHATYVRVLEEDILVGIGKASYGAYLIHRPAIGLTLWLNSHAHLDFFASLSGCAAYLACVGGITAIGSSISLRFERKLLSLKDKLAPRTFS